MKSFYYNVLLNKEDLADRVEDLKNLTTLIKSGKKVALYAPRRYGKSSIAKNILPYELKQKKFVAIYCDFMGAENSTEIAYRLAKGIAEGLEEYLPTKSFYESAKKVIKNLSFSLDPNPITGEVSFNLSSKKGDAPNIDQLLKSLYFIAESYHCLFIFDEFQDLHSSKDSLGLMRSELQKFKKTPMLFLGSKRRLLSEIFNSHHSPFFNFADEYSLKPIPIEEWTPYFSERLSLVHVQLSKSALQKILDLSMNVPNTICEIGSYIQEHCKNKKLEEDHILKIIDELIDAKSEGFQFQIKQLSKAEQKVLYAFSINRYTAEIQGKDLQNKTNLSLSGIKKTINKLYHLGIVEEENNLYRTSNPLLALYLLKNKVV